MGNTSTKQAAGGKTIRVSAACYARLARLNLEAPALGGGSLAGIVGVLSLARPEDAVNILQTRAFEGVDGERIDPGGAS